MKHGRERDGGRGRFRGGGDHRNGGGRDYGRDMDRLVSYQFTTSTVDATLVRN